MRAGGCTLQQTLTAEAATVIKQAVTLAKRRGHAQVTPLHVANTMLSSSQGLLRTACLQSHSHPLQCKALELCFNVALNRLPASTSVPMMGSHSQHHHPSISNALVAAFKRAQAHQRRGSIENQQQPLLAVKIELEQLIISILDDPSVSRVMREASFSSTQVKTNVEKAVSLETSSRTPSINSSNSKSKEQNLLALPPQISTTLDQIGINKPARGSNNFIRNEDVSKVIETLLKKKRRNNPIIVGECVSTMEDVIREVMDKVEKGDAPDQVRDVKFISLSLHSLTGKTKEEVEYKVRELRSLVNEMGISSKGVILYLGDLKWTTDFRVGLGDEEATARSGLYCPVEHMIMELGKLVCDGDGQIGGRFWLMGVANFQTYIKCRDGHPSLESVWSLLPLTIAADSLSLSLNSDSSEVRSSQSGSTCNNQSSSSLPTWLRQYKDENKRPNINDQEQQGQYTSSGKTMPLISSVSPSSSNSGFSYEYQKPNFHQSCYKDWPLLHESMLSSELGVNKDKFETSLTMHIQSPFSSNPNSTPNSTSSSDVMDMEYISKFKNVTAENFKILCGALENKVPGQMDIIPDIASTILRCRSGMKIKRKGEEVPKEETWLLFQGPDVQAKVAIGRELARVVFGSRCNFFSIALSSFSSTRADSTEYLIRNKRSSVNESCSCYIDRFFEEVSSNPHRVFFIQDIEQADYFSQMGLKRAIERGKVTNSEGQGASLCDSIIILSCESISSRSRACSPPIKQKNNGADEVDNDTPVDLDLNLSMNDDISEDGSIDDIGILESVDRRFVFKIQEA